MKKQHQNWINPAKQMRSQETQNSLMNAALQLFRENGFDVVTVSDIALQAGVSPGTIYRRFSDKEGLLNAVHVYFTEQALEIMTGAEKSNMFEGLSLQELLIEVIKIIENFVKGNQRLLQSSYSKALTDERFAERFVSVRKKVFSTLRRHFLKRKEEIKHPNPEIALDFALRFAMGTLHYRIEAVNLEVALEPLTDEEFNQELMRAFLNYLGVSFKTLKLHNSLKVVK